MGTHRSPQGEAVQLMLAYVADVFVLHASHELQVFSRDVVVQARD